MAWLDDPGRPAPRPRRRRRRGWRIAALLLALLLALPIGLGLWANSKLHRVEALTGAAATAGTTYLIAGTDQRGTGGVDDAVSGARADVIMVLNVPPSGMTALMSIPRDTYAAIPGHGHNKINAAYALGGAPLLVAAVEELTGLSVDHYVEVGFGSLTELVDAVGGVELCLDYSVADTRSKLDWEAGCRLADGATALAFSRMRYSDPDGDIGRAGRQREVLGALIKRVATPSSLVNPGALVTLVDAGTAALAVDQRMNILDLARLAWALKAATGPNGATGTPAIASLSYQPGGGVGSAVLLDDEAAAKDFRRLAKGTWTGTGD
jgi:LCP family protein required for cell wall assembly